MLLRNPKAECQLLHRRQLAVELRGDQPEHDQRLGCLRVQLMPFQVVEQIPVELDPGRATVFEVLELVPALEVPFTGHHASAFADSIRATCWGLRWAMRSRCNLTRRSWSARHVEVMSAVFVSAIRSSRATSSRDWISMTSPCAANLRRSISSATRVRMSSSLLPAMRAAISASHSCAGQPTALAPILTPEVQRPRWMLR